MSRNLFAQAKLVVNLILIFLTAADGSAHDCVWKLGDRQMSDVSMILDTDMPDDDDDDDDDDDFLPSGIVSAGLRSLPLWCLLGVFVWWILT